MTNTAHFPSKRLINKGHFPNEISRTMVLPLNISINIEMVKENGPYSEVVQTIRRERFFARRFSE